MQAGKLRQRISVISPISTARSTDGAPVVTFSTTLKDVWCEVQNISARENFRNDMRWAVTDKIFKIRYTTVTIGPKDKIVYSGENYDVQSVIDVGERHREFELVGRKTT